MFSVARNDADYSPFPDNVTYLTNHVPAADGNGSVTQRFDFEGTIEADGVRWPRTLRISQSGKPYFELHLSTFHATPKP